MQFTATKSEYLPPDPLTYLARHRYTWRRGCRENLYWRCKPLWTMSISRHSLFPLCRESYTVTGILCGGHMDRYQDSIERIFFLFIYLKGRKICIKLVNNLTIYNTWYVGNKELCSNGYNYYLIVILNIPT